MSARNTSYELAELKEVIGDMQRKAELREVKFSRAGTEKNVKFAEDVRQAYSTDMKRILRKMFSPADIPAIISDQLSKGDKIVEDRIHLMRVADEYGWAACVEFQKEELARNAEEERKIRRLRKEKAAQLKQSLEKKEKEEARKKAGFGSGAASSGWRNGGAKKAVCYRCNRTGHIARNCFDPSNYDRRRSGRDYDDKKGDKKKD